MKCKRISVLFLIICNFLIFSSFISAQTEKSPQQIKLSENKKSFPFQEGKTIIAEVKFIGLDTEFQLNTDAGRAISVKSFLGYLDWKKKTFITDEKFNSKKVSDTVKLLKQWLAGNGYLKAEIVALGEKLPENRMNLVFSVKRNSPVLVSEIRFTGNKFISESEYIQVMKNCLGGKNYYDKDHYGYCAAKYVRDLMFSKGYFKSRIYEVSPKYVSDSYIITVRVDEGTRHLIGKISLEGAKVFSEKEIGEIIGVNTGDIANALLLREAIYEKLKKRYYDNGYALYNGEFDVEYIKPQIEGQDGIVNINIIIEEGRKFEVRQIEFAGIEQEQSEEFKESFPLKKGEVFNQSKIVEGIKKLNETEKFYPIDSQRNVELRVSESTNEIDIVVKLTKIE